MKRKQIILSTKSITFEEGFKEYLNNCKLKNLREATITHNINGYKAITKYIPADTPIEIITKTTYDDMIIAMRNSGIKDSTLYIYCSDFRKFINYFIEQNYLVPFTVAMPKVDKTSKDTYTDEELKRLLKKPNLKTCSFTEYKIWVLENLLLSTGVRLSSFINIKIKDLDFDNCVLNVTHTKNRKPLIIPLNKSIQLILKEYLKHRQHNSNEDYLFCNIYGDQLTKVAVTNEITRYNQARGCSRGIHKFRHTFAKKWILAGASLVSLSKMLGHSNLQITSDYVNLLVSELQEEVDKVDIISTFTKDRLNLKS